MFRLQSISAPSSSQLPAVGSLMQQTSRASHRSASRQRCSGWSSPGSDCIPASTALTHGQVDVEGGCSAGGISGWGLLSLGHSSQGAGSCSQSLCRHLLQAEGPGRLWSPSPALPRSRETGCMNYPRNTKVIFLPRLLLSL